MKYRIFIPVRKGSERVKGKNTRPFAGLQGGLLKLRLEALIPLGIPIIVSTDDEDCINIVRSMNSPTVSIDYRPKKLCSSSTLVSDLIDYVTQLFQPGEVVIWCHVTAPFLKTATYLSAIQRFEQSMQNDSLMTVTRIQQFLWDDDSKQCINNIDGSERWPRTQDLKPLFEINHAFYIIPLDRMKFLHDRIGTTPFLYELDRIESFDIDWEDDFLLAERLYKVL
jgi:CMP-N-acetylneuraminic acid synthetase